MADPISSNLKSNTCGDVISSSCVTWDGPNVPCLNLCKGATLTDVEYKSASLLCNLITQLNMTDAELQKLLTLSGTPPIIDISGLNWGCLYSPTITSWVCPIGQSFLADTSAPNGAGYCQVCSTPSTCYITTAAPIGTTIANPLLRPSTLLGALQLIIDHIPCCDPCANKGTVVGP